MLSWDYFLIRNDQQVGCFDYNELKNKCVLFNKQNDCREEEEDAVRVVMMIQMG